MSDGTSDRKRGRGLRCCGMGCAGIILAAGLFFVAAWTWTGRYRPAIPAQPPAPVPNGFDDFVAAAQMVKASGGTKAMQLPNGRSGFSLAGERAVVTANSRALDRLRLGLTRQWQTPNGRDTLATMDHMQQLHDVTDLLRAEYDVRMAKGDYLRAADVAVDAIQLGQVFACGGLVTHSILGRSAARTVSGRFAADIERMPADACSAATRRLASVLLTAPRATEILQQEKWSLLDMTLNVDRVRRRLGVDLISQQTLWDRVSDHFTSNSVLADIERQYDFVIRYADTPPKRWPPAPTSSHIAPADMVDGLKWTAAAVHVGEARDRMLLAALSLRSFRLHNGRTPVNLVQLGLEPRLLRDPFSGDSLVYQPSGDYFLLYSVGPDGRDDGGIPVDEAVLETAAGDLGLLRFSRPNKENPQPHSFRRVPHMLKPEGVK